MINSVNILGTEYQIKEDSGIIKSNADGLCKEYEKEISVRPVENMLMEEDDIQTKKLRHNEVMRHEIIHAFFSEAGLDDFSNNELLVNWIAIQFPKILKSFEEVGAL